MAKRTITFHGSDKSGEPHPNHELQRLCNMMHRKKLLSRPSIACNGFPGGNHIGEDHLPLPRTDSAIQINLEVPWKSSKLDVNPVLARKLLCSNFKRCVRFCQDHCTSPKCNVHARQTRSQERQGSRRVFDRTHCSSPQSCLSETKMHLQIATLLQSTQIHQTLND